MTTPRRPRAARSVVRRPVGARTVVGRGAGRSTRTAQQQLGSGRASSPLTTRAAILGLVVCTLVVSAALPLREFLAQRSDIAELEARQRTTTQRVSELEHDKRQLEDPAFVAAEARRRLHMARPGEVTYVVVPPSAAPAPAAAPGTASDAAESGAPTAAGPDAPWWSQLWSSVEQADQPAR